MLWNRRFTKSMGTKDGGAVVTASNGSVYTDPRLLVADRTPNPRKERRIAPVFLSRLRRLLSLRGMRD